MLEARGKHKPAHTKGREHMEREDTLSHIIDAFELATPEQRAAISRFADYLRDTETAGEKVTPFDPEIREFLKLQRMTGNA